MKKLALFSILSLTVLFPLSSCGGGGGSGGGGGGGEDDPAFAELTLSRHTVDSGDLITVKVHIENITEGHIMVKVRFPEGLRYVQQSTVLVTDVGSISVNPGVSDSYDGNNYLVYFLNRSVFSDSDWGDLIFEVKGFKAVESGELAVDIDYDDPNVQNSDEFRIRNPNFTPTVEEWVEVTDMD